MTSNTDQIAAPAETMRVSAHVRAILVLGLPLIGGHMGQMAIAITDTVMMGWYGVDELAAVTLGSTYFFLFFLMGTGFAWAVMPLVATFDAEGDETGLRRATRMGMWLSVAFGLLALPAMIWSGPILRLLGQSETVVEDAATYLRIAGWGIFPALGVMVLKSYLAALERTQIVLWAILAGAVVNGLFNYAFIFGNWGAPELGLRGAAWASIVTQAVTLALIALYARRAFPGHDLFRRLWRVDGAMLVRVLKLGWPIGLTSLSESGLFTASAIMMGWLGTVPLAAHGIAVQMAGLTFMVHMGLSNAATIRAGNALGRRDAPHLARGAWVAMALSFGFAMATVVLYLTIPEQLISLYMDPDEPQREAILAIGVGLLAMAALFQLVDGMQVIALGLLRGVQDTTVPMIMAGVSYWLLGMPASYYFGFVRDMGGLGVWLGLVVGLAAAAILLAGRFWLVSLRAVRALPA